jgi:hypothetical protein
MKIMGYTAADMEKGKKKGMGKTYALMLGASFITAMVLSHIITFANLYFKETGAMTGVSAGFWVWLGFMAPLVMDEQLWGSKPWSLFYINGGYRLVSAMLMGGILAGWAA